MVGRLAKPKSTPSHPADRVADSIGYEEVEPQYVYHRFRLLFGFELVTN